MHRVSSKCWIVNSNHPKNLELESGLRSGSTFLRCVTSKSGRRHRSSHFAWLQWDQKADREMGVGTSWDTGQNSAKMKVVTLMLCQTSRVSHFQGPCQIIRYHKSYSVILFAAILNILTSGTIRRPEIDSMPLLLPGSGLAPPAGWLKWNDPMNQCLKFHQRIKTKTLNISQRYLQWLQQQPFSLLLILRNDNCLMRSFIGNLQQLFVRLWRCFVAFQLSQVHNASSGKSNQTFAPPPRHGTTTAAPPLFSKAIETFRRKRRKGCFLTGLPRRPPALPRPTAPSSLAQAFHVPCCRRARQPPPASPPAGPTRPGVSHGDQLHFLTSADEKMWSVSNRTYEKNWYFIILFGSV